MRGFDYCRWQGWRIGVDYAFCHSADPITMLGNLMGSRITWEKGLWACLWGITLITLTDVGRLDHCGWHRCLTRTLDCIKRKSTSCSMHSRMSGFQSWPPGSNSGHLGFSWERLQLRATMSPFSLEYSNGGTKLSSGTKNLVFHLFSFWRKAHKLFIL